MYLFLFLAYDDVQESRKVSNRHSSVIVHVCQTRIAVRGLAEHDVHESRNVVNRYRAVIVHIAFHRDMLYAEVAGISRSAVKAGIFLIHVRRIIRRAVVAFEIGAVQKHIAGRCNNICVPSFADIDGRQCGAFAEHIRHRPHILRIEAAQVEGRQAHAAI